MGKDTFFCKNKTIRFRGEVIDLNKPLVMGILNITPDSFYDGGRYRSEKEITEHVQKMIDEGASIIDVGAVSTRPGSALISLTEEKERLSNVFKYLSKTFPDIWFSVDTFRSEIAKMVVEEFGVFMVNDISSGDMDERMFETIFKLKVPYVMMHMKGTPSDMQKQPEYINVTNEIIDYFSRKVSHLKSIGIADLVIDPGFGFGKTIEHNYTILKELNSFAILDSPVLVGMSRKSMVYNLIKSTPMESLNGTLVVNSIAILNGADILRVHDVKPAIEAIEILSFYKNS